MSISQASIIPSVKPSFMEVQKLYWDAQVVSYTGTPFPRDLGQFRFYPKGTDTQVYYGYILDQIHKKEDAFVAFYSDNERATGMINRIFIDLDEKAVWDNMKLFLYTFWNNIQVFYSGKKGFHIYLYIEPTPMSELHKYRSRLYSVMSTWAQAPVDAQTWLDIGRMCRIPLTRHRKDPHRYKIPLHYNLTFKQIVEMAEHPEPHTDLFYRLMRKKVNPVSFQVFLQAPSDFLGL
jgi:hypothetical protein